MITIPDELRSPKAYTPEWYAARRTCFGASEAAAVCGLSPYRQPLDVFLEKTSHAWKPIEETPAMRLGKALEPVVLGEYSSRTGIATQRNHVMRRHPQYEYIAATLDAWGGEITSRGGFSQSHVVECKSSTFRRAHEFGEEGTDFLPNDIVLQCQQQMGVVGRERCDVAVLLDGRTLRIYTVHFNGAVFIGIVQAMTELWERIQNNDPPEPNWTHPSTLDLIKGLYGVTQGHGVMLSEDAGRCWERYRRWGQVEKKIKAKRDELQARVLAEMGEAASGVLPGGEIEVTRTIVNRKGFTVEPSSYLRVGDRKVKTKGRT